jgi:hypothetical protein
LARLMQNKVDLIMDQSCARIRAWRSGATGGPGRGTK